MTDATAFSTATAASPSRVGATSGGSLLLWLFFLSIILPVNFNLGGLAMGPYRVYLVIVTIPFMISLFTGRAGRVTVVDAAMIGFGFWVFVSLFMVHGTSQIAFGGSLMIELVGGYLTGRILVRTPADYERMFRIFFMVLLLLFPFALYEWITGRMIIAEMISRFALSIRKLPEWRWGLSRTQVVFPSSILWGLFCSFGIASFFYAHADRLGRAFGKSGLALVMTCFSMSSGPLLSGMLQYGLILWDVVTRSRWKLLLILGAIGYVVIDALSNRTPFMIFIETFTFSPGTAWARIFIWRYGTAEVWRHPWFGIGLNDWVRATWMRGSVDNFWLLTAMRHGLPAIVLLLGGAAVNALRVLLAKHPNRQVHQMRTGYLVTTFGLFFTLSTVHAWGSVSVMVAFFIGIGACFWVPEAPSDLTPDAADAPRPDAAPARRRGTFARSGAGPTYARAPEATATTAADRTPAPQETGRRAGEAPRYSRQTTTVSRNRSRP